MVEFLNCPLMRSCPFHSAAFGGANSNAGTVSTEQSRSAFEASILASGETTRPVENNSSELKANVATATDAGAATSSTIEQQCDNLVHQFGCERIGELGGARSLLVTSCPPSLIAYFTDDAIIKRIEKLTGKPAHVFLRRGLFFAHRDLNELLDAVERKEPFYLYTGRGPSAGSLHLGHLLPFMFTRYLQEAFGVQVVIQITDDEKMLHKNLTLEQCAEFTVSNVKVRCGERSLNSRLHMSCRIFSRLDTICRAHSSSATPITSLACIRLCCAFKSCSPTAKCDFERLLLIAQSVVLAGSRDIRDQGQRQHWQDCVPSDASGAVLPVGVPASVCRHGGEQRRQGRCEERQSSEIENCCRRCDSEATLFGPARHRSRQLGRSRTPIE